MTTPFLRVPINSALTNKPTTPPTDSMRQECVQKQHAAQLWCAEPKINTSPRIQTQAQVAMAAAWVVPPALSTHLHTWQSNLLPPSRHPGFVAAMMQQQQHQRGMVWLLTHTTHHTTGEQGSPSIGSHGCRYRQAPQLQAINEKHKIQKGMELFIGQQIWTISKQHRWQNKEPHQHHPVHLPTQGTEKAKARRYVRAICVHSTTQKGWTQSTMIHCRRRENQLSGQSCHPHHGNASGQDALQQRHLHERHMLHDDGHLQLLPHDTFAPTWIHPNEIDQHPRQSHQRI